MLHNLICLAGLLLPVIGASGTELLVGPYLQNVEPTAITVMWETADPCVGGVRFSGNGSKPVTLSEEEPRTVHELRLTGLEPASSYSYEILWDGEELGPWPFRTAPPVGKTPVRIAFYGDSRTNSEVHRRCVEVMMEHDPELIVNAGDLVSDGKVYEQWKPQFFDPLAPLICSVPIYTVLGNHERNSEHYYSYYDLPNNEAWWTADFGVVHLIALDSCRQTRADSEQTAWLREALENAPRDRWIVVVVHGPLFSAHPTRGIASYRWHWQPLFQEYGVDLVITGHDHQYQRCHPVGSLVDEGQHGVVHFTTGGGGAGLYPVYQYSWTACAVSVHNVTILEFDEKRVKGRAFSENGEPLDEYEIARKGATARDELIAWEALVWERELLAAAEKRRHVEVDGEEVEVELSVPIAASFPFDLEAEVSWNATPAWRIETEPLVLKAGEESELRFRAHSTWPQCYPAPRLEIVFRKPSGVRPFRNDRVEVWPLRVWPRRSLTIPEARGTITIDAEPTDWEGVTEHGTFIRAGGEGLAEQQTQVRLARDAENLYAFAYLDLSDNDQFGRGDEQRDDPDVRDRDEAFTLNLATRKKVYTFAVNTLGTLFDAEGSKHDWNADWEATVQKTAGSWYCELRVPFSVLDSGIERVNFTHTDGKTGGKSQWVPTFGRWLDEDLYGFVDQNR